MKIIRPEQPQVKKEELQKDFFVQQMEEIFKTPIKVKAGLRENLVSDSTKPIEHIMDDVIDSNTNTITFEITLTKRQYEIFNKKGGVNWLKKALVGQKYNRKKVRK